MQNLASAKREHKALQASIEACLVLISPKEEGKADLIISLSKFRSIYGGISRASGIEIFRNAATRHTFFKQIRLLVREWKCISNTVDGLTQHYGCYLADGTIQDINNDMRILQESGSGAMSDIKSILEQLG